MRVTLHTWGMCALACLVAAGLLSSCGGSAAAPEKPAQTGGWALPAPELVAANITDRNVSSPTVLYRHGADFDWWYAQHAAKHERQVVFDPLWVNNRSPFCKLAYGIYQFNLTGYTGEAVLTLNWTTPPPDLGRVWVGFSDWERGGWDWQPGPGQDGRLLLPQPGFEPYRRPGDPGQQDMLVAVVVLGDDTCELNEVYIQRPAEWTLSWGTSLDECAFASAMDRQDNLVVCGIRYGVDGPNTSDGILLKISPDGAVLWAKSWDAAPYDIFSDVVVDDEDNIYITGASGQYLSNEEGLYYFNEGKLLLIKYSSEGELNYANTYDDAMSSTSSLTGTFLTLARTDAVYISGTYIEAPANDDAHPMLMKTDRTGRLQWARTDKDIAFVGDGRGVTTLPNGEVVVLSTSVDKGISQYSMALTKCSPDGELLRQIKWDEPEWAYSYCGLIADTSGMVYVLYDYCDGVNWHPVLAKMNADFEIMWQRMWNEGGYAEMPANVILDTKGNPILVSEFWSTQSTLHPRLMRFAPDGEEVDNWLGYGYPGTKMADVAMDSEGAIISAGHTYFEPFSNLSWQSEICDTVREDYAFTKAPGILTPLPLVRDDHPAGNAEEAEGLVNKPLGGSEIVCSKFFP